MNVYLQHPYIEQKFQEASDFLQELQTREGLHIRHLFYLNRRDWGHSYLAALQSLPIELERYRGESIAYATIEFLPNADKEQIERKLESFGFTKVQ